MLKIKKIKPMFNHIVTTADIYGKDDVVGNGLILHKEGDLREYQKVISVGPNVHGIKEGDLVVINPIRYGVKKHQEGSMHDGIISDNPVIQYRFNIIELDDIKHLLLYDSDVEYVIEDYEEVANTKVITDKKTIII